MTTVVLLGPPGVGKGTQGAALVRDFGFLHVCSGELLREQVRLGTPLGRVASELMSAGRLVPDELVEGVITEALSRGGQQPVVVDGYPKTAQQARSLDRALATQGRRVDLTLSLSADRSVLRARLLRRAVTQRRGDDREAVAVARVERFATVPADLLDHYRGQGVLVEIDSAPPLEVVTAQVRATVGRLPAVADDGTR